MIRRRGTLFVVSAPSGAGKTTLCREVRLSLPDLAYSVSVTTRPPRPGEMDGVDFRFVGVPEFRAMLDRGELAEWATVHGNLYGTRARSLEDALAAGRDVLLDKGGSVGRALDFLIQELNREINTIASKADDLELSQSALAAKGIIEKMREQAQNLE